MPSWKFEININGKWIVELKRPRVKIVCHYYDITEKDNDRLKVLSSFSRIKFRIFKFKFSFITSFLFINSLPQAILNLIRDRTDSRIF